MSLINITYSKFFSTVQESPWYRKLMDGLIDELNNKGALLDIGTGSGKLLKILSSEKDIRCVGVDTSAEMLKEAETKLFETDVELILTYIGKKIPLGDQRFDHISISNLLFLLDEKDADFIMEDALSLLAKEGGIYVLTPTGKRNLLGLTKAFFSIENWSIYIWYFSTRKRAMLWSKSNYLETYATKWALKYSIKYVLDGYAQIEILRR